MHNDPGQLHLLDLPAGCGGAGRVWLRRNANTACQTEKLPLLFAAHCLMSRIACLMRTLNSDTVSSSSFCIASMGMQTNMPAERQPRSPAQQHREALRSTATAIRTRKHRQAPGASIKSSECSFEARKPTAYSPAAWRRARRTVPPPRWGSETAPQLRQPVFARSEHPCTTLAADLTAFRKEIRVGTSLGLGQWRNADPPVSNCWATALTK